MYQMHSVHLQCTWVYQLIRLISRLLLSLTSVFTFIKSSIFSVWRFLWFLAFCLHGNSNPPPGLCMKLGSLHLPQPLYILILSRFLWKHFSGECCQILGSSSAPSHLPYRSLPLSVNSLPTLFLFVNFITFILPINSLFPSTQAFCDRSELNFFDNSVGLKAMVWVCNFCLLFNVPPLYFVILLFTL